MGDSKTEARPDLSKGIAIAALSDHGILLGRVGDEDAVLARSGGEFFAVGATALTITDLSPMDWLSRTRSGVRGITPASVCAVARRCARRPWIRFRAGESSAQARWCSCGKSFRNIRLREAARIAHIRRHHLW